MDVKAFPALIVGVVVALVLFGATLPAWGDINDDMITTYTNTGGTRATMLDLSGTHTIISNGTTITIDGGDPITVVNYNLALASDQINGRRFGNSIQWGSPNGATIAGDIDLTITDGMINGTLTSIASGTVYTFTNAKINYMAYPDNAGAYTMVFSDNVLRSIYLTDPETQFYSANFLNTTGQWFSYYNGVLTVGGQINDTMTFTGEKVDYDTTVYRYTISQDDIVFTVDNAGEDYTVHPYICVVPYEVHGMATQTNHIVATLLSILPLLIGAGLVLGAVAWFIVRKR